MSEELETRILYLEKLMESQAVLNAALFNIVFRSDNKLRMETIDVLRRLQVNPSSNISPELSLQITAMRDALVLPIPQEVVEASRQPSIRPVE